MRSIRKRAARRLSVVLVMSMLMWVIAPVCAAEKAVSRAIHISSFTDLGGSINIDAGKAEGIGVGMKGVVLRDGKKIADYEVVQVNWGFSRIELSNLESGYTVSANDSAPITTYPEVAKKSKSKTLWIILAVAAAAVLLGSNRGGGGSSADGSISLTADKSSTSSDGDSTASVTITARVNQSDGSAAPDGTSVAFSTTAGALNSTKTTTSAGRATAILAYDPLEGLQSATVTVRALGKTASITVSLASSMDLVANPTTIQVTGSGGSPTEATITATCLDASGNPATSGTVKFASSIGTVTDSVAIGAGGVATTKFRSDTSGRATITATWLKSKATITVTVTAGPPYSISVTSNTNSVQCDGNSYATITATVKDAGGSLVKDSTVVNFSVIPDGSGGGNGTITPQASTVNGAAIAHLTTRDSSGNTSKSGTATIKAEVRVANQPPGVPAPATDISNQAKQVQFISMVVGGIILSANPSNVRGWDRVGNTTTITAAVSNSDGLAMPDGTVVTFRATHGIITGTATTSGGLATATLTTDASGSGSWNGLVDVTATASGVSVTHSGLVIFSGPAWGANCDATMSQSTLSPVGGQATISVTARDVNNNPVVDGTRVTATTDKGTISGGGSGTTTGGSVVFTLATSTDAAAPTQSGSGTVDISIETGGVPVTKSLSFTVGP